MEQPLITEAFLKDALRQAGCPVCRICRETENRHLKFLLHENVNDVSTRIAISRSLGFCRQHSWQLLNMEVDHWIVPLGSSIIYEDLVNQVMHRIEAALSAMTFRTNRRNWQRLLDCIWRWPQTPDKRDRNFLEPIKTCRVCESSCETAQRTVHVMIRMLCSYEIQQMYVESDGTCLPHLRLALPSKDIINPGIHFLINNALERLSALQHDLGEFKRKQHWHHRDEMTSENERTAARRAVTFFAGEE